MHPVLPVTAWMSPGSPGSAVPASTLGPATGSGTVRAQVGVPAGKALQSTKFKQNSSFRVKSECGKTSQFFPKPILPQPGGFAIQAQLERVKTYEKATHSAKGRWRRTLDTEHSFAQEAPSTSWLCPSLRAPAVPPGLLAHPVLGAQLCPAPPLHSQS